MSAAISQGRLTNDADVTSISEMPISQDRTSPSNSFATTTNHQDKTSSTRTKKYTSSKSSNETPNSKNSKRASKLFDVLYDNKSAESREGPPDLTSEHLRSPSYVIIEKAILEGQAFSGEHSPHVPIVTVIDRTGLQRSGSIISSSASLRHRNTIKRRNKMMRRDIIHPREVSSSSVFSEFRESKPEKKWKSRRAKILSIFPVRRRTSYKYNPASNDDSSLRFSSQKDIDRYFMLHNIKPLMKSLLPDTMKTFQFKKSARLRPQLISHPVKYNISSEGIFTPADSSDVAEAAKKAGLEKIKTFEKSQQKHFEKEETQETEHVRRREILEETYGRYKRISFAGKRQLPSKVDIVLPQQGETMTAAERDALNTRILFEVLLRRTLAAKIEFRVKQNERKNSPDVNSFSYSSFPYSLLYSLSDAELSLNEERLDIKKSRLRAPRAPSVDISVSDDFHFDFGPPSPSPPCSFKYNTSGHHSSRPI